MLDRMFSARTLHSLSFVLGAIVVSLIVLMN